MNSGVLQFSLGLATGGFLRPLGGAMDHLKGFIATAIGFGAMVEGVKSAIERGTQLQHLHQQTGESVKDLYELQEAFKAVGVDSQQLPMMLLRMQQALSGLGRGAANMPLFARVGLDIQKLKQMDAPAQIDAIAQALSKVDKQTATGVVAQLFGIETGAVPFLQVVGSAKDFHDVLADAAEEANVFAHNAVAFEHFDTTLGRIKGRVSGIFAGIAQGLIPSMQKFADTIKAANSVKFGENIGRFIAAFANAFSGGKMSELIALSLKTGFDTGIAALPATLEKIGFMLLKIFETPLEYLQAGMEWIIQKTMELIGKIPKVNELAGLKGFKADAWSQILDEEKKNGLKFNLGTGEFGLEDINKDSDRRWQEAKDKMKRIAQPLMDMLNGLAGKAPALKNEGGGGSGKSDLGAGQNQYKPEFTSLEKMGFVLGGNSLADFARRTADNTARMVTQLGQIAGALGTGGGMPSTQVDLT